MRLRNLPITCGVLVFACVLFARSTAQVADTISGTWTGFIGPGTNPNLPTTLDLKFDGKNGITGVATGEKLPGKADLTGTFDPATGVLKMTGEIAGNPNRLAFDGTVVLGTVTGRITPSAQPTTGVFVFKKQDSTSAAPASPASAAGATSALLGQKFAEVSGWVTKAADLVPADKYTYQPAKTVRTFGQLVAHVADAYGYYCGRAAGKNVQWSDAIANGKTDKATVVLKLKQAAEGCNAAYATSQSPILIENIAHTSLHYGNIITYMRMLGLVPPSSS